METHHVHGMEIDFHGDTHHNILPILKSMDKHHFEKFLEETKEGHDKDRILNGVVKHEERDGGEHVSIHLHHS